MTKGCLDDPDLVRGMVSEVSGRLGMDLEVEEEGEEFVIRGFPAADVWNLIRALEERTHGEFAVWHDTIGDSVMMWRARRVET